MSFYWQQGLPQQPQDTGQSPPQQQGQWDFINLGGAPAPQHQWNPNQVQAQAQHNYYYSQPHVNGSTQHAAPQQWASAPAPQQVQQQTQLQQHQQIPPVKAQPVIEHTPIFHPPPPSQPTPPVQAPYLPAAAQNFTPAPPVLAPSYEAVSQAAPQPAPQVAPQQYHQVYSTPEPSVQNFPPPPAGSFPPSKEATPERQQVPVAPVAPVAPAATVAHAPAPSKKEEPVAPAAPKAVEEQKVKVTPTSSEDDWEKADMEVQRVDDENKRQKVSSAPPPVDKPVESRESSSLGGSWSQQDTSERSSAEPVEIVEHPVIVEEEKTPRVSMSENTEKTPTPAITTIATAPEESRQETPDTLRMPQNTSLTNSSPGVAIATSTPKDFEKRPSLSSQETVDAEKHKQKQKELVSKPVEKEESGNNSDSTMASGRPDFERGHARASYREYKKTYMEICDRLKMFRQDTHHADFRPSSKLSNPLLAAAGISLSRHPAIRRESNGGRNDGRSSVPLQLSQSHSFTDGAVNGGRRSRVSRLDPRPSSRQTGNHYDSRLMYDQRYAQQQNPHYRQGRYSAMGLPYRGYEGGYDSRRPQSCYQDQQNYPEHLETSSYSESEECEENGESDEEVRQYNAPQNQSMRSYTSQPHHHNNAAENSAMYYCGVVHVNMESWRRIKEKQGIPEEFYNLGPIEMAAFMFYTVVFGQPYKNVDAFHKRFNREFYKYRCDDNSEDDALFMICRSMQEQYLERQKQKQLEFQQMKATLFSDDTSIDGQSDMNSVYDESNAGDVYDYGPRKFTCPHSFMHISTGGQIISIQPEKSISAVVFDDIKGLLKDLPTLQVKEAAQTFKGPLVPNQSAPHTVRLYISKQIENIKRSAVAQEDPKANDVVEALLVWQLLETMVKQQGNITGPDIAELLAKVASDPVEIEAPPQPSNITPALNKFTEFLLGGHIEEAIEIAMRNGLFADALVLTRRLFPNDEKRIEKIESRFLETRYITNPVTTLVSVAKGEMPPVLTNPATEKNLSWRTHAAIILANLDQRGTAMKTIYSLGRALAKRDYHCAADFCFLVCCVLGGDNPFVPQHAAEGEEEYRRHISLVNSYIPDNESYPECQYGFLISDLHATEIFDYALRLKPGRISPLAVSVEYQTARMKYAKLLANHGFTADAYRYCTEIARDIWNETYRFKPEDLMDLVDLADSLHFAAGAAQEDTTWIGYLRTTVTGMMSQQHDGAVQNREQEVPSTPDVYSNQNQQNHHEPKLEMVGEPVYRPAQPEEAPVIPELVAQHPAPPVQPSAPPAPLAPLAPAIAQIPEPSYVPPTPAESVHNEPFVYPQQPTQQQVVAPHEPAPPQPSYDDIDGFTSSADYNDSPLTMASSAPPAEPVAPPTPTPPAPQPQVQTQPAAPQQQQQPVQPPQQPPQQHQQEPIQRNGSWLRNTLNKMTQENPMRLPEDTNPTIKWDPSQNKYVGEGVEQEPQAPPPSMMAPVAPTGAPTPGGPTPGAPIPGAMQAGGGGLRAVRGANRYARTGLSATPSNAAAPAGMMPVAPPTASFGFMPAPVDDGADAFDPFNGQANPTIQQSGQPLLSDE